MFSTMLRTTREAEVDAVLTAADTMGCDPLPKLIKRAQLRLGRLSGVSSSDSSTAGATSKATTTAYERTAVMNDHES